ncbi:conserved hypothetical protein [Ricinus communis]|uniref:Uncharacterized protein n=1 Tax=Ricinus communis TaxID=3988 RepID=B9T035_RICCO|nr:conserved hypothetical protein [Ricinus communis]
MVVERVVPQIFKDGPKAVDFERRVTILVGRKPLKPLLELTGGYLSCDRKAIVFGQDAINLLEGKGIVVIDPKQRKKEDGFNVDLKQLHRPDAINIKQNGQGSNNLVEAGPGDQPRQAL